MFREAEATVKCRLFAAVLAVLQLVERAWPLHFCVLWDKTVIFVFRIHQEIFKFPCGTEWQTLSPPLLGVFCWIIEHFLWDSISVNSVLHSTDRHSASLIPSPCYQNKFFTLLARCERTGILGANADRCRLTRFPLGWNSHWMLSHQTGLIQRFGFVCVWQCEIYLSTGHIESIVIYRHQRDT